LGVFSAKDLPIEGVPQMITWLRSLLHNKSGRKTDLDIPSPIGQLRLTQDRAPVTDTALVDHPVLKDEYGRVVASIHTDAHPVIPSGVTFAELDLFTATNVKDTEVLPFSNSNEMERDWHRFQETIKNQAAEIERLTQTLQTETYQARAQAWIIACFGLDLANDKTQRNQRLLEETCELVQKGGCTLREIKQIAEWVYTRPMRGGMEEDVGGVMHSLAAFCSAYGMNMHEAGEIELLRVWENADHMRKTFATKPMFEPEVEESTVLVEKAKAGQVSQAMLKAASASYARNGSMRIALEAAVREQITPRRPQ
jgi:hypothetical protein